MTSYVLNSTHLETVYKTRARISITWGCYSFILIDLTLIRQSGLYDLRLYAVAGELAEPVWFVVAPALFLGINSFAFAKGDVLGLRDDLSAVVGHYISINITGFSITVRQCPNSQPYYIKWAG